ncbi:MAG TPA: hypothetical protein VNZ94_04870 [Xanthobacteraceae bacterium]|nr:hypothetical protein [Xanthobacteraceae bacterium]
MARSAFWRRIGAGAAWAAVYAFVLNAMLATSLLAATPVIDTVGGYVICIANPAQASDLAEKDGAAKRAASHCKSCLPGLAHALPPPNAPDVYERVAVAAPQHFAFQQRLKQFASLSPYRPRGPPTVL